MSAELRERLGLAPKLLTVLCAAALSVNVWAQDDAEEEEEAAELDRVVVTGSLIKREDFTSNSPTLIINADVQAEVGQLSAAQMLQQSTIAAGATQFTGQRTGFITQGGTGAQTLNLRGLGQQRTLILLNGRRPGASGTRGEVNVFDLNNIPEIALSRFEIVSDGASTLYGSDAVAGVANIITRTDIEGLELTALLETPEESGGEWYRAGAAYGWQFDRGSFYVAAQWELREAVRNGDRDFLNCTQDLFFDGDGNIIDREDRSITAGTSLSPCQNLYANTVLNDLTGERYIPAPDGMAPGSPIPGYRPRENGRYDDPEGQAFYEDVLNFDYYGNRMVFNELERMNVYSRGDFNFDFWGGVDWDFELMYNQREIVSEGFRQFFPTIVDNDFFPYPNDPTFEAPLPRSRPVIPYDTRNEIDVKYFYASTGLEGTLNTDNYWGWRAFVNYSRSDGDYTTKDAILGSLSGDIFFDDDPPQLDYFSPEILSGQDRRILADTIGRDITGNTIYDQWQAVAILSGDLFQVPAGVVAAAFGLEYRWFSIDDQPPVESVSGDLWNSTSALVTEGDNSVIEAFTEFDIPLLAGLPGIESLTLNLQARAFEYDVGGNDWVWKAGLNWQISPEWMVRTTAGTSYRAPGLFELFLGDQTGFQGQLDIDPCVDWGQSSNEQIRQNCAAEGIPEDYIGAGSSALIISGGGAENLEPETSDAFTFGIVWTPEFTDLSIAVDYIDFTINNEIDQLGPAAILGGCYNSSNFPNTFCDLFTRAGPDGTGQNDPYNIIEVTDTFINVNEQTYQGIDLNVLWNLDVDWGSIEFALQSTWNLERLQRTFDPTLVEGFDTNDFAGAVGSPENTTLFRTTFNWEDWRFNYFMQYIGETDDTELLTTESDPDPRQTTYFGFDPAFVDLQMDAIFYHNLSVVYVQDNWNINLGVNNVLDEEPDTVSDAFRALRGGNLPVAATQYDIFGRRLFLRFNWNL